MEPTILEGKKGAWRAKGGEGRNRIEPRCGEGRGNRGISGAQRWKEHARERRINGRNLAGKKKLYTTKQEKLQADKDQGDLECFLFEDNQRSPREDRPAKRPKKNARRKGGFSDPEGRRMNFTRRAVECLRASWLGGPNKR